jgi:hypothetical protein
MITIKRDKRDREKRLVLRIGDYQFHLSDQEAYRLRGRLNSFKLKRDRA